MWRIDRLFGKGCALVFGLALLAAFSLPCSKRLAAQEPPPTSGQTLGQALGQALGQDLAPDEREVDLLIVGATESGWAAAIQAARMGVPSILIVHDGKWLGGQYTEQALVCVDENKGVGKVGWGVDWHPMKRSFHRSGLFKLLMDRIEAQNTELYGEPMPGRPFHGPSTFRPAEAERVFRQLLQPYVDRGQVQIVRDHYPVRADVVASTKVSPHPRLRGLAFAPLGQQRETLRVRAALTIDASDWGEAIQLSGAAYECGPDPQTRYGEPSAPKNLDENPRNEMNPITWAMVVEEVTPADVGQENSSGDSARQQSVNATIPRPPNYDDRNYPRVSHLSREVLGKLPWDRQASAGSILHWPPAGKASPRQLSVHTVRRIVDGATSKQHRTVILLNYMNGQDYPLERLPRRVVEQLERLEPGASQTNIVEMTREQRNVIFQDAKNHSLGVLHHLQTFVHDRADDTANSFRHFRLSPEFGTPDQLPPKPYIRESLRLKAMYMMREQDGRNRDGETKERARERMAHVLYPDGVLPWQFHYDFHRTGRTYLTSEGDRGPWIDYHKPLRHTKFLSDRSVLPLRSLIPIEMDGLLGAQKNLGYSSIVSAAIRLHDQCVAIGQAAGAAAAVSLKHDLAPRAIPYSPELLEHVRAGLCPEPTSNSSDNSANDSNGQLIEPPPMLLWPYRDLLPSQPSFVAVNRLAAAAMLPRPAREVDFQPDSPATEDWVDEVAALSRAVRRLPETLRPGDVIDLSARPAPTRGEFCVRWWERVKDAPLVPRGPALQPGNADGDALPDVDDPLPFTPNEPIRFTIEPLEPQQLTPETDGVPPGATSARTVKRVNFCGPRLQVAGWESDHGERFSTERGRGWQRDLTASHRRRQRVADLADTFLFTRTHDVWECALPNGRYRVTLCIGDAGHEQLGQNVTLEGQPLCRHVDTEAGAFLERQADIRL
ncbi:MAG: FAD-dependent oxidoreductase, partial [Planctomycetales bacterium]|nr:FAD-dependent oxidoreductase [Planctomycetales bacterium]